VERRAAILRPVVPVLAIFGPTAVGKTAVAIAVAQGLRARGEDAVAISADALQIYDALPILTGAAGAEERAALEHRLVGVLPVAETCSAGRYAHMAHEEIDAALEAGRRPIVVGGTGLYLRAALTSLDLKPPPDPEIRARWREEIEQHGAPELHRRLTERDPGAAARVDPNDAQRLIRAHELLDAGQEPPSGPQLWTTETRHPTKLFGLTMERDALYERINARVDAMLAAGVEEEVRRAVERGASPTARKAVGFEEVLSGDIDGMKARTRRYAKRQLTWMRKLPDVALIDLTHRSADDAAHEVLAAS
jgi:tRNA dimethylallyltransferase